MNNDDFINLSDNFTPISKALENITGKYKLPKFSGGSGKGWSYWSTLARCPYSFYLKYVLNIKEESESTARELGSIIHAFLAWWYVPQKPDGKRKALTTDDLQALLLEENVNPAHVAEGSRVFNAYALRYEDDYLTPLAVEFPAGDVKTGNTCRYDLVARIEPKNAPEHIQPGVYVVEHKSCAQMTRDVIDGWNMDGEILGEIAFWKTSNAVKKFGKLQGLIVNVVGKQKSPLFHRTFIAPSEEWSQMHLRNLAYLKELEERLRQENRWPRYNCSCIGRYGRCQFYDRCAAEASDE